jgi:hypothetical protein
MQDVLRADVAVHQGDPRRGGPVGQPDQLRRQIRMRQRAMAQEGRKPQVLEQRRGLEPAAISAEPAAPECTFASISPTWAARVSSTRPAARSVFQTLCVAGS